MSLCRMREDVEDLRVKIDEGTFSNVDQKTFLRLFVELIEEVEDLQEKVHRLRDVE